MGLNNLVVDPVVVKSGEIKDNCTEHGKKPSVAALVRAITAGPFPETGADGLVSGRGFKSLCPGHPVTTLGASRQIAGASELPQVYRWLGDYGGSKQVGELEREPRTDVPRCFEGKTVARVGHIDRARLAVRY